MLFILGGSLGAYGTTCDLNVSVYRYSASPKEDLINDASIELRNDRTYQWIKTLPGRQTGYFEKLGPGDYTAFVKKVGFKTTARYVPLNCEYAFHGIVEEIAFLWDGVTDETVGMDASVWSKTELVSMSDGTEIPVPKYPESARGVKKASGPVAVYVLINEFGRVAYAKAIKGHKLLRTSAEEAARNAKFKQTKLKGMPVKISGVLTFNFVP